MPAWKTRPRHIWLDDAIRLKLYSEKPVSWDDMPDKMRQLYPKTRFTREMIRIAVRNTDEYRALHGSKVVFQDKLEPSEGDIDSYMDALKALNSAVMRLETKQTKATITLYETKPFGIAFWGDWHYGAKGIDYEQLDEDSNIISETDGLYVIGMGDYKDNASAIVHPASTQESIAPPDMQSYSVKRIVKRFFQKWLAFIRGCHDDWDKKNADVDFVQDLCDIAGAVNLWHGGVVTIQCGDQEYKIVARHKYKNESSLNLTNAQRNMMNDFGPCDVFMLAHKHYYDLEQTKRMGRDVIYGRSGSYKVYDEYGQKLAGYEAIYGVPVIIFFPDRKEMIPVKSLKSAATMLKSLRS